MRLLAFAAAVVVLGLTPGCSSAEGPSSDTPATPAATTPPSATTPVSENDATIAMIDSGKIRGVSDGNALVWKGIPYAAPPVGANRWRPPQAVVPWTNVRDASSFGSQCVQTAPDTSESTGGSEDCLTLNVWRPNGAPPPGGWPVMVFVHGGYNLRGSSSFEIEPGHLAYDGKALANRGVVYVSMNYRLGALGWMGHAALKAESSHRTSGNYGSLDQIAALEWVQRNARVFGADPARVLLFGQSAGATNTCMLFVSPLAKGLFSRAVMHSGVCPAVAAQTAEQAGAVLAAKLGCDSAPDVLACLRAKPAANVAAAMSINLLSGGFTWGPIVDGWFLPASPATLVATRAHNHMPFVIGVTAHEMTTLWKSGVPTIPVPSTPADHEAAMRTIYGAAHADRVIAEYPASGYPSPALASVAATSDASFICPAREIARAVSAAQTEPVRRFYFSHVLAGGPARSFGAGHGFDLLFAFATYPLSFFMPTDSERALSESIIGYLTRFAATGDPNDAAAPLWPSYDAVLDTHLVLDDTVALGTHLREEQCNFWRTLAAR